MTCPCFAMQILAERNLPCTSYVPGTRYQISKSCCIVSYQFLRSSVTHRIALDSLVRYSQHFERPFGPPGGLKQSQSASTSRLLRINTTYRTSRIWCFIFPSSRRMAENPLDFLSTVRSRTTAENTLGQLFYCWLRAERGGGGGRWFSSRPLGI